MGKGEKVKSVGSFDGPQRRQKTSRHREETGSQNWQCAFFLPQDMMATLSHMEVDALARTQGWGPGSLGSGTSTDN